MLSPHYWTYIVLLSLIFLFIYHVRNLPPALRFHAYSSPHLSILVLAGGGEWNLASSNTLCIFAITFFFFSCVFSGNAKFCSELCHGDSKSVNILVLKLENLTFNIKSHHLIPRSFHTNIFPLPCWQASL